MSSHQVNMHQKPVFTNPASTKSISITMQFGSRMLCIPARHLYEIHHPITQQPPCLLQHLIYRQPTLRHPVARIQPRRPDKRDSGHTSLISHDESLEKLHPLLQRATVVVASAIRRRAQELQEQKAMCVVESGACEAGGLGRRGHRARIRQLLGPF
jgi:hypothetical protein